MQARTNHESQQWLKWLFAVLVAVARMAIAALTYRQYLVAQRVRAARFTTEMKARLKTIDSLTKIFRANNGSFPKGGDEVLPELAKAKVWTSSSFAPPRQ